jgi:SAM-dependent methyltransferase
MINQMNSILEKWYVDNDLNNTLVLEAGGGSFAHFSLPEKAQLLALDIEFGQLSKNNNVHMKIQGDLHALPIAANSLDMIVCFNVIEHLGDPELVLSQLVDSLKPGGIILVGCPNRSSLKGLVTLWTPYEFHRWYYRVIVGKKDRGDGHFDVFPTPFKKVVSAKQLPLWFTANHLKVTEFIKYDGAAAYNLTKGSLKANMAGYIYYSLGWLGKILSFGSWDPFSSDLLLLAQKQLSQ